MKKLFAALAVSLMATTAAHAAELAEVDKDGNGMVTMEEAKAMWPDMNADAFSGADADGDGSLNAAEFATLKQM